MAPWHVGGFAGFGDDSWQDGVAREAFGLMNLAGIHIGLSRVACGIDEKLGLSGAQRRSELSEICVVKVRATQAAKSNSSCARSSLRMRFLCSRNRLIRIS